MKNSLAALLLCAGMCGAQEPVRLVAEFGEPLPGAGGVLDRFERAAMLTDGSVAFHALTNEGIHGIWINNPDGQNHLIIREDDELPAPLGVEGIVLDLGDPFVDDQDSMIFAIRYEAPDGHDYGMIVSHSVGTGEWVVLQDESLSALPLPDGVRGTGSIDILRNPSGTPLFSRHISSPMHPSSSDSAVWRGENPELVTLTREIVGGTRPMVSREFMASYIRPSGDVLLDIRSEDIVVLGRREWPDEGLFDFTPSGGLVELGRVGDSVPGAMAVEAFVSAIEERNGFASHGTDGTAYVATFRHDFGAAKEEGDVIILAQSDGTRRRVVARGDQPPGAALGDPGFGSLWIREMTHNGGVVFYSKLESATTIDDEGLWVGFPGGRADTILLEGQSVPNSTDIVKRFDRTLRLPNGDLAINCEIGPLALTFLYPALYVKPVFGPARPVLKFEDEIDLGGGRIEQIERIGFTPQLAPSYFGGGRIASEAGEVLASVRTRDANSLIAVVRMPETCRADCDGNGTHDVFDFLCFQNWYLTGRPEADCNGDGELDLFDFMCFQSVFASGCP